AAAACALAAGWLFAASMQAYWTERWFVWLVALYVEGCLAIWSVSLFAIAMDLSWPRIAGSQFTAYMALLNVGTTFGGLFAKYGIGWFGFRGMYIFGAGIQVAIILLLLPIDPGETRRKLPLPEGTRPSPIATTALFSLLAFLIAMTSYAVWQKL